MDYVVETIKLSRYFASICAVYRLDMKVPRGCIFGLLGPNGAGKSTAIKMLVGNIFPTYGDATVLGYDIVREREEIMTKVG